MTEENIVRNAVLSNASIATSGVRDQKATYFILAVLGLSFWFFLGLPFASHRETYAWLAGVQTESLAQQFSFGLSSTYRPLSQVVTRAGFLILDATVFPTSVLRQTFLQAFVYAMFILAWWLIYSVASFPRLFAAVALVCGGVFFSGYVHLFHIYGMFYVPVILTLGILIRLHALGTFEKHEIRFAAIATVLALWHPFATALYCGFYFGFCLETFHERSRVRRIQSALILLTGAVAMFSLVAIFPRAQIPTGNRLLGFLLSYQTNEVNGIASLVAFALAQLAILSMIRTRKVRVIACLLATAVGVLLAYNSLPLLFLWFGVTLIKLFRMRSWGLFFLMLTAMLLPFGGGIGTPIYGLFAIIVATYVTSLAWPDAEEALAFLKPSYAVGVIFAAAMVVVLVRSGIEVPIVTRLGMPLLTERERTYQLESALAWLHKSDYCGYEINFTDSAGSPVDSTENVITRRNRPPAALGDVQFFWNKILRCQDGRPPTAETRTAVVTFGDALPVGANPVFVVKGKYAGDATVWIPNTQ